jgi:alpha-N-arabinofuranosidase
MYKPHQGATHLAVEIESPEYRFAEHAIPAVSASASRDSAGKVHLSMTNLDPNHAIELKAKLSAASVKSAAGRVLTAPEMNAHNTFNNPPVVKPAEFTAFAIGGGELKVNLPSKSVVSLEIRFSDSI